MARALLALVQQAAAELGLTQPTQLLGNTDLQAQSWLAHSQREGKEFSEANTPQGGWPALRSVWTFNLAPGQQSYSMPADVEWLLPQTAWDATRKWQALGPLSPQEWYVLQYGISPTGPRLRFIQSGSSILVNPTPTVETDQIAMPYISNAWCTSASAVNQSLWAADTDTYRLDEEAFILGIKWRFLRAKGLSYAEEFEAYESRKSTVMSRAGGSRDLRLDMLDPGVRLLSAAQVPDTGFGA